LWWLWVLLGIILLLLALICWRLFLAYSRGYSFTDPTRYNRKYSPQEMYARDLIECSNEQARQDAQHSMLTAGSAPPPAHKPDVLDL